MCSVQRSTAATPLWHSSDVDRCIQIDLPRSVTVGTGWKGEKRYSVGRMRHSHGEQWHERPLKAMLKLTALLPGGAVLNNEKGWSPLKLFQQKENQTRQFSQGLPLPKGSEVASLPFHWQRSWELKRVKADSIQDVQWHMFLTLPFLFLEYVKAV